MTSDQRQILSAKHDRLMKRIYSRYNQLMYEAVQSQVDAFVSDLLTHGQTVARRNMEMILFNTKVAAVIKQMYTEIGVFFANKKLREINASVKVTEKKTLGPYNPETKAFGFDEQWIADIISYFRSSLLDKAVIPITQETRDMILAELEKGVQEGLGYDEIARRLQSRDFMLWRALLIVRTESVKAMAYGQEIGVRESKYETEDVWISAKDHRTRHSHMLVDGDKVITGGRFQVPVFKKIGKIDMQIGVDLMKGPGDNNAHISNLANCRCTKVTRARRDENGRLILKRTQQTV